MPTAVPSSPRNPLRTYQFRVGVVDVAGGGAEVPYVAGVRSVSGLGAEVSAHETWEGGNNLHRYANPNRVTWGPITLEQGLALDDTLERWSEAVLEFAMSGRRPAAGAVKRQVILDVQDENRRRRYRIHNAWISKYQALPRLDAMSSEVALLSVELVHEGWVREAI